uniref:Uncharacterized protein n=1 Tax=Junco hyemalis TaxID=40217 RepID=A0A8C5J075_JUNHY
NEQCYDLCEVWCRAFFVCLLHCELLHCSLQPHQDLTRSGHTWHKISSFSPPPGGSDQRSCLCLWGRAATRHSWIALTFLLSSLFPVLSLTQYMSLSVFY